MADLLGSKGFDIIADTSIHNGDWFGATILEDAVISSVTSVFVNRAGYPGEELTLLFYLVNT